MSVANIHNVSHKISAYHLIIYFVLYSRSSCTLTKFDDHVSAPPHFDKMMYILLNKINQHTVSNEIYLETGYIGP